MPTGSFWQAYVKCPFFKCDNGNNRITCEGLVDRSSIILAYRRKTDFKIQITAYCCRNFEKCELYSLLMKSKYQE